MMREKYIEELKTLLEKEEIMNADIIIERYEERFDLGIEAGLSEEEIINKLKTPQENVEAIKEDQLGIKIKKIKLDNNKKENYEGKVDSAYIVNIDVLTDDVEISYIPGDMVKVEVGASENVSYSVNINKIGLNIKDKYLSRKLFSNGKTGYIHVFLPEDIQPKSIHVAVTSADIIFNDIVYADEITLVSVSGNMKIEGLYGEKVTISTVGGDVESHYVNSKEIRIDLVSGSANFEKIDAVTGRITSVSGNVKIVETSSEIKATSISGKTNINGKEIKSTISNIGSKIKGIFKRKNKE